MENDAIGTIEMIEATSTNGQLTVTRVKIKEEDVISSTTNDDSSTKSAEAENEKQKAKEDSSMKCTPTEIKAQTAKEHLSKKSPQPEEMDANPKDNSSNKSPEVQNKDDNRKEQSCQKSPEAENIEDSSKKSPEPKNIEEHSKPDAPNPDIKKENVKRRHGERKSVPVLEGVKAPSSDDSEESLQAFKMQRRKKKKHNKLMQKQMITHFFKLVKKVKVKQEKIDPYFNDTAKKVQGNGSVVKVTAEIHAPPEEGKSDVSTSTEKNHDNFVSSGHTSTVQGQKTVTPEVPQVFKREVIDLTYEDACRNEMATQMEDFPPLQPDTSDNGIDLSKSTTTDKDISSTNSVSINVEDASATSFNTSSDSINTFALKMQHLNLKKGDDNLNEVEPKLNELNQGPKLIEVSMNGEENYSDQGKKAENAPKTQESYSHFVQSISPPSRVTSSSPV